MRVFDKILITFFVWFAIALLYSQVEALDDFDLAKYGPKDTVEVERTDFIVKLILYNNKQRLNEAFEKSTNEDLPEGSSVRGFAVMNDDEDVCFVHIIPPEIWDDRESMAIMGHEIYHCALADHRDVILNETAEVETEELVKGDVEDLYAQDRLLELEWLQQDYDDMGIVTN
jgi:hypothetical protein